MPSKSTSIAFADEYVLDVLNGEKTATVRYDDYENVLVGDRLAATTADGEQFAVLRITRTATAPASSARRLLDAFGAAYPTSNAQTLLDNLNEHYGDEITDDTWVRVLAFEVVE